MENTVGISVTVKGKVVMMRFDWLDIFKWGAKYYAAMLNKIFTRIFHPPFCRSVISSFSCGAEEGEDRGSLPSFSILHQSRPQESKVRPRRVSPFLSWSCLSDDRKPLNFLWTIFIYSLFNGRQFCPSSITWVLIAFWQVVRHIRFRDGCVSVWLGFPTISWHSEYLFKRSLW